MIHINRNKTEWNGLELLWYNRAREIGAAYLLSVLDSFSYDDYPVYVMPNENLEDKAAKYDNVNMQRINWCVPIKNVL